MTARRRVDAGGRRGLAVGGARGSSGGGGRGGAGRLGGVKLAVAAAGLLALTGCGATSPAPPGDEPAATAPADPAEESPVEEPQPELTAADIAAWAAEAEWSFASFGLEAPVMVQLTGGTATDDAARTYELGEPVEADVDGDGVMDAALPITRIDGNAAQELWYVWRGIGLDAEPVAEQVIYPVARTTRCGDVTHAVSAGGDGGLQIDLTLRMPHTDDDLPCSQPGTGELTRHVQLEEIDGRFYPVQTEPVAAWGGVCPPSQWLDGLEDVGISGRAAPPASAPIITDSDRKLGLFELADAPLVTADGAKFFGFIQDYASDATVKMHCAFG